MKPTYAVSVAILESAAAELKPEAAFAMFSGGHDSLCSTHLAMSTGIPQAVVHINTGIGIPQTREFVRNTCAAYGWPLLEYHPPKLTYRDIVLKFGFPGPGFHHVPYRWLKERAIDAIVREHKRTRRGKVMLITGVRRSESTRRMGHIKPLVTKGARAWVAPIIGWDDHDKNEYMQEYKIPRNEVVDLLCMSGECLCGAFAKPGELDEVRTWFPGTAAEIDALAEEAAALGKHAIWGVRQKRSRVPKEQMPMDLCWSCEAKLERMEENDGTSEVPREARV